MYFAFFFFFCGKRKQIKIKFCKCVWLMRCPASFWARECSLKERLRDTRNRTFSRWRFLTTTTTQTFRCIIALRSKTVAHTFFHLSTMQMAVSVKIQKFCYHNNLTSHFSSLLRRTALLKIMQNTAECLKSYTKMNGVLTLFVLAESTQVKWYKWLRLWL